MKTLQRRDLDKDPTAERSFGVVLPFPQAQHDHSPASPLSYPDRVYLLSDTFGGQRQWHPFNSTDIDAHLVTDVRSCARGVRREFDIFGAERITDHVLRKALALQDENPTGGTTGIFINHAARVEKGKNGEPFYVAHVGELIRIVATPLAALSAVRDQIRRLQHLSNENNGLYGPHEQFRSSFTTRLLTNHHGLKLIEDDPAIIPPPLDGPHLSYTDRFGNLVVDGIRDEVHDRVGQQISVCIGGVKHVALVDTSLDRAEPGRLVVYGNDGHLEVIAKWNGNPTAKDKLKQSAYIRFGQPPIGAPVRVAYGRRYSS